MKSTYVFFFFFYVDKKKVAKKKTEIETQGATAVTLAESTTSLEHTSIILI